MSVLRSVLLAGSESAWLRARATRYRFLKRAVKRFMPGERADDALQACDALQGQGATSIVTYLGENLRDLSEAESVRQEYLALFHEIKRRGLPTWVSVKPTQLGLDLDPEVCFRHLSVLAEAAESTGNSLWIDMESSAYVDITLELYRRLRASHERVGVCLQAYLRRTADDLERLLPRGPSIRLVKGAYKEPSHLVLPSKADVDEQFFTLACRLVSDEARQAGAFAAFATHDPRLIARLETHVRATDVSSSRYEFEMLYGIQRAEQQRLVRVGRPLRVLISYGEFWFPWFMRRLAERPANVWFVVRNLVG
jgi:proline dehydrogenase